MNTSEIINKLCELLQNNGFYIDDQKEMQENALLELDSLQYITFISDIEQEFDITVPDEFLDRDQVKNLNQFSMEILKITANNG